jgi:hypothetical protein
VSPLTSGARLFRSPVSMLAARREQIHRATTRTPGTASTVPGFSFRRRRYPLQGNRQERPQAGCGGRGTKINIKGPRHYTASQLLAV